MCITHVYTFICFCMFYTSECLFVYTCVYFHMILHVLYGSVSVYLYTLCVLHMCVLSYDFIRVGEWVLGGGPISDPQRLSQLIDLDAM